MKERALFHYGEAESLNEEHGEGLRPVSWPHLVERFAKARAFRNWHLELNEKDNANVLSNKNNLLPESGEIKFCVNLNGLGIGKSDGDKAIAPSNRNRLAPEEEHD